MCSILKNCTKGVKRTHIEKMRAICQNVRNLAKRAEISVSKLAIKSYIKSMDHLLCNHGVRENSTMRAIVRKPAQFSATECNFKKCTILFQQTIVLKCIFWYMMYNFSLSVLCRLFVGSWGCHWSFTMTTWDLRLATIFHLSFGFETKESKGGAMPSSVHWLGASSGPVKGETDRYFHSLL